ncbi:hypothetical protein UlMin_018979 [Ulmus minor]
MAQILTHIIKVLMLPTISLIILCHKCHMKFHQVISGADFHCFKYKIEPKWEDLVCANGGKWTMIFQRGKSDTCWLYRLLAMIGEQFDHGDEICGAVVNVITKQQKISIWTKNALNEASQVMAVNSTIIFQATF